MQQISTEGVQGKTRLGRQGDPLGNVQEISIRPNVDFALPADHRIKLKQCEKKYKYLDLARELKKLWNMQVTIIPIVIGAIGTVTKGLLKGLEDLEVGGRVEDHPNDSIIGNGQNSNKSPGDLPSLRLQLKKHRLTLMGKAQMSE